MKITWHDGGREPQCPPNPDYPKGIDLVGPPGPFGSCKTDLPYPAKRCGHYTVVCEVCGASVVVTTAGRPDDPRSLTMACADIGKKQ